MKTARKSNSKFSWLVIIAILFFSLSIFGCTAHISQQRYVLSSKDGQVGSNLKSEGLKFSSDFFPILPWGPYHGWKHKNVKRKQGLCSIAECNFTMAGFVKPEDLPLCEELGLAAIILDDYEDWSPNQWTRLSDEQIDERIRTMIGKSGNSKSILGYYIADEPNGSHFPALAKAVQAVKKYAPGKLAYINLFPNYAQLGTDSYTEYLEKFVNEVKPQIISYDNYKVQYSNDLRDSTTAASYYTNLMEVRRVALKYNLPFWNIVSSNQIRPFTTIPSPSNLLFQAYTTLAAGGRGVSWYTYYSGGYGYAPIDESDNKTLTWWYLREVNRQIATLGPTMNRLTSTGVYFTSPAPVESLPVLPGKLVEEVKSDAPMMVGEFKSNEGVNYVMVVNLSLEKSARFILKTVGAYEKMQIVSAEDGTLRQMDNEKGFWLVAGQGVLIKLL